MIPITESESKHIRELLRSSQARREHGEFVVEGPHLLEAALQKRPDLLLRSIFTDSAATRYADLVEECRAKNIEVTSLTAKLASRVSDTQEPQGIFGLLRIPESNRKPMEELILVLDGVQDPGNVGTIIRTAGWFNVRTLIMGEGTADPFAPKVVRSTQGAIFDVNIETEADLAVDLKKMQSEGWEVVATALNSNAQSLYDYSVRKKTVLLLGSEAHGVRKELLSLADASVVIPRYGDGESLNVATSAAVILSEFRRRSS